MVTAVLACSYGLQLCDVSPAGSMLRSLPPDPPCAKAVKGISHGCHAAYIHTYMVHGHVRHVQAAASCGPCATRHVGLNASRRAKSLGSIHESRALKPYWLFPISYKYCHAHCRILLLTLRLGAAPMQRAGAAAITSWPPSWRRVRVLVMRGGLCA